LPEQHREAHTKRRIGVGFTGLADTLNMLGLRYDSEAGRQMAVCIAQCLRDAAYASSVALAREKGPFPLFSVDACLADGTCASRLPDALKADIRRYGLRNSHLLCIAPTGGLSLALADNTSSGIEPAFGWVVRHTLPRLHTHATRVENHALRVFKALGGGNTAQLPPSTSRRRTTSPWWLQCSLLWMPASPRPSTCLTSYPGSVLPRSTPMPGASASRA
jgi:ribonucleoside-diphosphate reductase alpha chain